MFNLGTCRRHRISQARNWRIIFVLLMLIVATCWQTGCNDSDTDKQSNVVAKQQSNRIITVSYALQYLTQRIVGDEISVEFPAADSPNPRMWSPSVEQIGAMQQADLVVANGPGAVYADWLERVTLDESRICHSCSEFKLKDYISVNNHQIVHSHGPEGEHSHPYFVPFPWLDPNMAIQQATTIAAAAIKTYPDQKTQIEENLQVLSADLKRLAAELNAEGTNRKVVTLNPQAKFLTRAIGFEDDHLLFFGADKADEPPDWSDLKRQLEQKLADTSAELIVTDSAAPAELKTISQELGTKIVAIDLLEKQPESGDFLSALKTNFDRLTK